ncbi:uncharacterized protein KY384_004925 [Bacidia gigantensis]|uniref:uncharacterized protein n=1 Tax=Bacidia gigantensis TaxID=2732470 RepID=UPI001D03A5F1|nr:uncharacterized protein KY384_004925 [Bacidia gigantensis]KAG8530423.1 hypothetical protein KY384_004925 [Bacidia gigantensis]
MLDTLHNVRQNQSLPCARCQNDGAFTVRTERLCKDCFIKYVTTKVIKRLEANKVRGGYGEKASKILIPISFGISSISLLHVLDVHLQKRQGKGRHAGLSVHLLFIDHSSVLDQDFSRNISSLKNRFDSFPLQTLLLEECFDYDISLDTLLNAGSQDSRIPRGNLERLNHLLSAVKGQSSKTDVLGILCQRLIAAFANANGFDVVLYGDTTSRLAERTLAETAKGRGSLVSLQTMDTRGQGKSNHVYAMRDLLRKELGLYAEVVDPPLSPLILQTETTPPMTSAKHNSIDGLMRQYVESVELQYPSVVANVVRTTGKLKIPQIDEGTRNCNMCDGPLWTRPSGQQEKPESPSEDRNGLLRAREISLLCRGCERTLQPT